MCAYMGVCIALCVCVYVCMCVCSHDVTKCGVPICAMYRSICKCMYECLYVRVTSSRSKIPVYKRAYVCVCMCMCV